MKKYFSIIILSIITFLAFSTPIKAETLDNLSSGDIIIGSTKFEAGTWISAARASKAGAFYAQDYGDIFVRTILYVDENVWYEMDAETGEYFILESQDVEWLKNKIEFYYLNGEPIVMEYDVPDMVIAPIESLEFEINNITNENVTYDEDSMKFLCPYNEGFAYEITYRIPNESSEPITEKYFAKCLKNSELEVDLYDNYASEPLKVDSVGIATSNIENNNQSAILSIVDNGEAPYNIRTMGELNSYVPLHYQPNYNKKWIGVRVNLGAYNVGYNYNVYSCGIDYVVNYGDRYIDIYFDSEYFDFTTKTATFVIIDEKYNKQERISFIYSNYTEGLSIEYTPENEESMRYIETVHRVESEGTIDYQIQERMGLYEYLYFNDNRFYINSIIDYASSYIIEDNNKLKVINTGYDMTDGVETIKVKNIEELHYLLYAKSNGSNYYSLTNQFSISSFESFYNYALSNSSNILMPNMPNATFYLDYFFEGEIPLEEQTKIDYFESLDNVEVTDVSNAIYN